MKDLHVDGPGHLRSGDPRSEPVVRSSVPSSRHVLQCGLICELHETLHDILNPLLTLGREDGSPYKVLSR